MIGYFAPIQPFPISAKPAETLPEPIAGPVPTCCRPTTILRVMVRQDMILDLTNSSCIWFCILLRNLGLSGNGSRRRKAKKGSVGAGVRHRRVEDSPWAIISNSSRKKYLDELLLNFNLTL
jgi:hypothetical protein